jgi:hypothetical protein
LKKWLFTTASYEDTADVSLESEISIFINGKALSLQQKPIIENGTSMLPLRTIFESLGAEVKWDEATKTVTASKAGKEIVLQIGSTNRNTQWRPFEQPVEIKYRCEVRALTHR